MDKTIFAIAEKMQNTDGKLGFDISYETIKDYYDEVKRLKREFKNTYGNKFDKKTSYRIWELELLKEMGCVKIKEGYVCVLTSAIKTLSKKKKKKEITMKSNLDLMEEENEVANCVWKYPLIKKLLDVCQRREERAERKLLGEEEWNNQSHEKRGKMLFDMIGDFK